MAKLPDDACRVTAWLKLDQFCAKNIHNATNNRQWLEKEMERMKASDIYGSYGIERRISKYGKSGEICEGAIFNYKLVPPKTKLIQREWYRVSNKSYRNNKGANSEGPCISIHR